MLVPLPGILFPRSSHDWILLFWPSMQLTLLRESFPAYNVQRAPCPRPPYSSIPPSISLHCILFAAHLSDSSVPTRMSAERPVTCQSWFPSQRFPSTPMEKAASINPQCSLKPTPPQAGVQYSFLPGKDPFPGSLLPYGLETPSVWHSIH